MEPHVVAELMREGDAAAVAQGDAEGPRQDGYAADVVETAVGFADNQVHRIGPGPVTQRVRFVQVAVRRIDETVEIEAAVRLGVRHLRPAHQGQALAHAARRVGPVGLRDHQVDLGLDRGGAARRLEGGRRIDDGHVDGRVRRRVAQRPVELDGRQPLPPGRGRARLRHEEVQLLETRLFQTGREWSRQAPGVGQVQRLEFRQVAQLGRERARQGGSGKIKCLEIHQIAQLGRNRPRQPGPGKLEHLEVRQASQLGRHGARQLVRPEEQELKIHQASQLGRNGPVKLFPKRDSTRS